MTFKFDTDKKRFSALELFLLSAASLYIELLIISWLSSDVRAFTVFKTFPLVTCFVGLGLGFAQISDRIFRYSLWGILQFVITMKLIQYFEIGNWFFPSVNIFAWQHTSALGAMFWPYVFMFICLLVLILIAPFSLMCCLGSRLSALFSEFEPLQAYCINIGGSIFGSLLFTLGSFRELSPSLLLIPVCLLIAYYLVKQNQRKMLVIALLPLLLIIVLASWGQFRSEILGAYWTPYQRLDVRGDLLAGTNKNPNGIAMIIGTNHCFYQYVLDLTPSSLTRPGLTAAGKKFLQESANNYNLPYKLKPAKEVLILGAGSGNDVAAALRNGAKSVDAVDIDPVIIRLGKNYHPEHPYDSNKVNIICNDARNYIQGCHKTYDLVIFGGLDSHIVTGQGSSVRIDNYVYTKESLQQALKLLKPDGMIVLSFCKSKPWLTERLFFTIAEAAGYDPICLTDTRNPDKQWEIYLVGPEIKNHTLKIPSDIYPIALEENPAQATKGRILTDNWPFVYVAPVDIDVPYLLVVAIVLLLSGFAARRAIYSHSQPRFWQMFFLGAAFLLLELQSIARLSLLFGSTWQTSSIVINSILLLMLVANLIVIKYIKWLKLNQNLLYLLLLLSLLVSYFLPLQIVGSFPVAGKLLGTLFTIAPIFSAGLIFATAFSQFSPPGPALAFNLFGAVIGAMLEYLSNYCGINFLVIVALFLYLASYVCARKHINLQKGI